MQDPRIRLISVIVLSIAAYESVIGALLTLVWWVISAKGKTSVHSVKSILILLLMPAIMGVTAFLTEQDGISYFIRMTAVLVVASWMYAERYQGELLDVSVWLFGERIGFDIGVIGELSMTGLEGLKEDIERIPVALSQKGEKIRIKIIPAVFSSLLMRQLITAHDRACLLTTRGYKGGGKHSPVFFQSKSDLTGGFFAFVILTLSLITSDLFITICQTYTV